MEKLEELVDGLHLDDLHNEMHPSMFEVNDGYDMLIVRMPIIDEIWNTRTYGFIITPESSYLYDRMLQKAKKLDNRFESPHIIIDEIADKLLHGLEMYKDKIEDMEESLYTNSRFDDFMIHWMTLKRDLLRSERILHRTLQTLGKVNDHYKDIEEFPVNHYSDLYEHVDRAIRSVALMLSKLDYLYNFYNIRTNEQMNRLIYILTLVSSIFLPLNLIVGFFGMNTSDLPFAQGINGTMNAIYLMLGVVATLLVFSFAWKHKLIR